MSLHQGPVPVLRSFVPGLAPGMVTGSRFEPREGQKVWIHYLDKWQGVVYDRSHQRFNTVGACIVGADVKFWAQMTPWEFSGPEIETFDEPSAPAWREQAKKVLALSQPVE